VEKLYLRDNSSVAERILETSELPPGDSFATGRGWLMMASYMISKSKGMFSQIISSIISSFLRVQGIRAGDGTKFIGVPIVSIAKPSLTRIGRNVVLVLKSHSTARGLSRPVFIGTISFCWLDLKNWGSLTM